MKYNIDKRRKEYQYAQKIISGEYLADEPEILACKRFIADLERQNDPDFPYCYDTTRADRFFDFFGRCVDKNSGKRLRMAEFQYFDFGNIFGWVDKKTGRRRFKEALIFEARGQAKSTACAIVSLYVLTADVIYKPYHPEVGYYELNPKILTLAVDREQTKQVRGTAMEIARLSPFLTNQIEVKQTFIRGKKRGGDIVAISKETGNLDGGMLNLIIADEWAAHKEEKRLNVLRGSFGKREQCLLLKITTAGDDAAHKPAKVDYDRCLQVLHGQIEDDTYFIVIRQLGERDDPSNFDLYEKCTPMLREHNDYSERLFAQIKDEHNKAFNGGSEEQKIEYLIKRTNRWQVGSEQKYLTLEELDMVKKSMIPYDEFIRRIQDRATVMGLDASKVMDLTGESFIFNLGDGYVGIYAHGFMPEQSLYRHLKTDKLPYEVWARQGHLTLISGEYIDHQDLKEFMCDFERDNNLDIKAVCADRAFCYQLLIDLDAGRTPSGKSYSVEEIPQTTTYLNEPCIEFEKLLCGGKLVICENPLFLQHCANAYKQYDKGGRMKISKKEPESPYRIDLLAATLNALRKRDLLESENLINAIASGNFSFI